MQKTKALCLDRQLCVNPEFIGLENENLLAQEWLEVLESGEDARAYVRTHAEIDETWVISCDDVDAINLAASIKKDRPEMGVKLIVGQKNGSLCSRAASAGLDEVVEFAQFVHIYVAAKMRQSQMDSLSKVVQENTEVGFTLQQNSNQDQKPKQTQDLEQNQTQAPFLPMQQSASQDVQSEKQQRNHKGFLMSVVSGSGGSGKSSVSTLAALYAADCGYRTLLLDFDLQFGDIASMVGSVESLAVDALIADPERGRWVFSQQSKLAVLAAPARLESSEGLVDKLPRLLDEALRHFDVIVANTGANWAEQHAMLLERSSVALFLLDQRSSSIRACHHALELCARCGIASVPFKFALNRCSKNAPFDSADVSGVMQGAPIFELRDGGSEVEEWLASGHAAELCAQGNEFAKSIERMMSRLLPKTESVSTLSARDEERLHLPMRRTMRLGRRRAKVTA